MRRGAAAQPADRGEEDAVSRTRKMMNVNVGSPNACAWQQQRFRLQCGRSAGDGGGGRTWPTVGDGGFANGIFEMKHMEKGRGVDAHYVVYDYVSRGVRRHKGNAGWCLLLSRHPFRKHHA